MPATVICVPAVSAKSPSFSAWVTKPVPQLRNATSDSPSQSTPLMKPRRSSAALLSAVLAFNSASPALSRSSGLEFSIRSIIALRS
ncbi:hypothetical protein [[Kitasatospora] papulosa]|uniref:hypothetical protein n=1 Tax=[Kitasatospora] papulosa TaxID=1464011 RepID=UPI003674C51D